MSAFALVLLLAAAESDPYAAWYVAPSDGARGIDRAVTVGIMRALKERVPAGASCRQAATAIARELSPTAIYYFIGPVRRWRIDAVPRPGDDELAGRSIYRNAPLLPFGRLIPLDPTIGVDGVSFGTDKLGHFFTNGLRAWERYLDVRAAGGSEEDGLGAAILLGVQEEAGWLGMGVCGVFSYADIHANMSGVRFFRSLCEEGGLVEHHGRFALHAPFRIRQHVDPCWDESFATSAFSPSEWAAVDKALLELCPLLDDPSVRARRDEYRRRGCNTAVVAELARLIAEGTAPDPSPWAIDRVCAGR
jgi:hypothetical protein